MPFLYFTALIMYFNSMVCLTQENFITIFNEFAAMSQRKMKQFLQGSMQNMSFERMKN